MKMNMNSDLTFITPARHSFLRPSVASGKGGSDGGNEKNQTLLDRFRVLII